MTNVKDYGEINRSVEDGVRRRRSIKRSWFILL